MRIIFVTMAALVVVLGIGCSSATAPRGSGSRGNSALRRELLGMVDVDQRVRQGFGSQMDPEKVTQMQAVDTKHTARMKAVIAEHGWPGRSLVGDDGAHAAWLLVQHADASFMAQCLPLMEQAVSKDEASAKDYAYLLDRVRMNQGRPQVYGTQFTSGADGKLVLHPVEDAEHVDERRRAVGLPPMAEYERKIREVYQ
ncbi:MAG: DUF6624 domain-containing protein [Verrucomicrobiia bacterium]